MKQLLALIADSLETKINIGTHFLNHHQSVVSGRREAQVTQYGPEQLVEIDMGVENKDRMDGALRVAHQFTQQGGFSGSHLAGNDYEALSGLDPVAKISVGLLVNPVGVKKTRIRGDAKG